MQHIPQGQVPSHHDLFEDFDESSHPQMSVEQVAGTRPVPVSTVRPRLIDPGHGSLPAPLWRDIPRNRLRRAHTIFGLIIASLFAFYLAWTFVQAGRDVVNEQPSPVNISK
jgi:hypothetical protein